MKLMRPGVVSILPENFEIFLKISIVMKFEVDDL